MKNNKSGISFVGFVIALAVFGILSFAGYRVMIHYQNQHAKTFEEQQRAFLTTAPKFGASLGTGRVVYKPNELAPNTYTVGVLKDADATFVRCYTFSNMVYGEKGAIMPLPNRTHMSDIDHPDLWMVPIGGVEEQSSSSDPRDAAKDTADDKVQQGDVRHF